MTDTANATHAITLVLLIREKPACLIEGVDSGILWGYLRDLCQSELPTELPVRKRDNGRAVTSLERKTANGIAPKDGPDSIVLAP